MAFNLKFSDVEIRCGEIADYWDNLMPMIAMEECGELIQAISKMERDDLAMVPGIKSRQKQDVIDEMGDVLICMSALSHRYSISEDDILNRLEAKINKKYPERGKND